jgi:hypothetical protein
MQKWIFETYFIFQIKILQILIIIIILRKRLIFDDFLVFFLHLILFKQFKLFVH